MTAPSSPVGRWWARLDGAAGGVALDLVLYAASTVFAVITAHNRMLPPHGAWGRMAVWGYAAATVVAVVQLIIRASGIRVRAVITALTFAATAVVPLLVEAVQRAGGRTDRAQDEVLVIEAGGSRLWHTGTPYLGHAAIAALPQDARLDAYLPYQPGMAVYGLPRAIAGNPWWTDARVWFLVTLITTVVAAIVLIRRSVGATRDHELIRAAQAVSVLPICALTIATGGDDLAVLGLSLLALALAARDRYTGRDRYIGSGIAIGVAGTMKLFAWPVALVLLAFAATRGQRAAIRYALGAIGLPIIVLVPAFLVNRDAAVENVIRFPLGRGLVQSPAASPFPGHLIADGVPTGTSLATGLLVLAALAIGIWLLRRPPRTADAAAIISACGLLAAILLIPSTRFGYLLYPIAYVIWAPALRPGSRTEPRTDVSVALEAG